MKSADQADQSPLFVERTVRRSDEAVEYSGIDIERLASGKGLIKERSDHGEPLDETKPERTAISVLRRKA